MAAFSYQYQQQALHLDSIYNLQTSEMKTTVLMDKSNNPVNFLPQFYQSNNEHSLTNKTCTDSSSITDKLESGEQVTQKVTSMNKKRKPKEACPSSSATSKDLGEVQGKKQKKNNSPIKEVEEKKPKGIKKDRKRATEEPPSGYIHVRARRGQATDSHSLAERVRREKISERMKLLQALVPGCDNVTGKALMLDEIINYVQSLQNQVEFLSMKLASLSPMFYDFGMGLDFLMATPDQRLGTSAPPVQNVQQCIPMQAPIISDTSSALATANSYLQLDSSASLLFEQNQIVQTLSQANGQLLWDVDDQRQKLINQSGLTSNLCSFH